MPRFSAQAIHATWEIASPEVGIWNGKRQHPRSISAFSSGQRRWGEDSDKKKYIVIVT